MKSACFLLGIVLLLFGFSCNDPDDDDRGFGIEISPAENYFQRSSGSVINFTVNIQSNNSLVRYRVVETINNGSDSLLKDLSISGKSFLDFFEYTVPEGFEFGNNEIQLVFSSFDENGVEMRRPKTIIVSITERPLTEFGGNRMYSTLSSDFDAYDLIKGNGKFSSDATAHIRDLSVTDSTGTDTLSRSWASPTSNIRFVKFNNFDYANATDISVETAYNTGVKNDTIRNLQDEDIILTKINNKFIAVKLNFVIDENGVANDRYIFSIKR